MSLALCACPACSFTLHGVLVFELRPLSHQSMAFEEIVQLGPIHSLLIEELHDATIVLRATRAQRDRHQVLWRHHPGRRSVNGRRNCLIYRFLLQVVGQGEKLYWPTSDLNILIPNLAAARLEIVVDWRQAKKQTRWSCGQGDKNVNVKR